MSKVSFGYKSLGDQRWLGGKSPAEFDDVRIKRSNYIVQRFPSGPPCLMTPEGPTSNWGYNPPSSDEPPRSIKYKLLIYSSIFTSFCRQFSEKRTEWLLFPQFFNFWARLRHFAPDKHCLPGATLAIHCLGIYWDIIGYIGIKLILCGFAYISLTQKKQG
jgi:hypothetical protein